MEVLVNELGTIYNSLKTGGTLSLPPLKAQYKEYTSWVNENSLRNRSEIKQFWERMLKDVLMPLRLPYDMPPVAQGKASFGRIITCQLNSDISNRLKIFCSEHHTSIFVFGLTAVQLVLSRFARQRHVLVGTTLSNRIHTDFEPIIGYLSNLLPVVTEIMPTENFIQLMKRQTLLIMQMIEFQDYSISEIISGLGLKSKTKGLPLINVFVDMVTKNYKTGTMGLDELQLEEQPCPNISRKFDMGFRFAEKRDALELQVEYDPSLFADTTITRIQRQIAMVTENVLNEPAITIGDLEFDEAMVPKPSFSTGYLASVFEQSF
jgi:non-ribosomal peptide synthetase component F